MILDDLDHRLLALLRTNARTPIAKLAAALSVSRATTKARLDRLVEGGAIAGFSVVMAEAPGRGVRAITMIAIEARHEESVLKKLMGIPEIRQIHTTNGSWDIVVEFEVSDVAAFDDLLRVIRRIDGVARTDTSILLKARKSVV